MFNGSKKGGIVIYSMGLLVFIILWVGWLSGLFSEMGAVAIANGATGLDGFLLANINLIIFIVIILALGWIWNNAQ